MPQSGPRQDRTVEASRLELVIHRGGSDEGFQHRLVSGTLVQVLDLKPRSRLVDNAFRPDVVRRRTI